MMIWHETVYWNWRESVVAFRDNCTRLDFNSQNLVISVLDNNLSHEIFFDLSICLLKVCHFSEFIYYNANSVQQIEEIGNIFWDKFFAKRGFLNGLLFDNNRNEKKAKRYLLIFFIWKSFLTKKYFTRVWFTNSCYLVKFSLICQFTFWKFAIQAKLYEDFSEFIYY